MWGLAGSASIVAGSAYFSYGICPMKEILTQNVPNMNPLEALVVTGAIMTTLAVPVASMITAGAYGCYRALISVD